jgi:hypothetical protein
MIDTKYKNISQRQHTREIFEWSNALGTIKLGQVSFSGQLVMG